MKKLILAVSFIILSKDVLSQATPDSVAYYSYMLVRSDKPFNSSDLKMPGYVFTRRSATCFFVRVKERLFLVTALHAVNNEEVNSQINPLIANQRDNKSSRNTNFNPTSQGANTDESFPFIELRYFDDSTRSYEFFPINYEPRNIISPEYLAKHPDVEIIEIKGLSKHASIHSIENILTADRKNLNENKDVIFYGFKETLIDGQAQRKPVMPFDDPSQYHGYVSTDANSGISEFNAVAGNRDFLYYYFTPFTTGGASGAPVFFMKSDVKNKVSLEFAGVQSATSQGANIIFVTHETYVMKLLKKRINQ